jgi:hypothetical protein
VLPVSFALMVQVPAFTKVAAPAEVIVQTAVVDEVKVTACPELETAVKVGVVPKFWVGGWAKVTVGGGAGVTMFEAADSGLLPTPFVAWTVNVYAVPLVSPLTVHGDAAQVPVMDPGVEVAV